MMNSSDWTIIYVSLKIIDQISVVRGDLPDRRVLSEDCRIDIVENEGGKWQIERFEDTKKKKI